MPSSGDTGRSAGRAVEQWNRRLHYYLGLYFLFFLWLFSATGLMLNHQQWFRNLYDRAQSSHEFSIETPAGDTLVEQARDVMRQLNLQGEIDFPAAQPVWHIDFNVSRPNGAAQVRVDLTAKEAYVREFENGRLHAFQILHTFSGSRFNQPASQRDWIVTSVWVWAMDALAGGLIVMVLGSYYMWWRLKKRKTLGIAVLAAGIVSCGVFVAGFL
jgi:hypothetical protein